MSKTQLFLLTVFLLFNLSCSHTLTPGTYRTNVSTYGMFGKKLTLNCDSTVVLNFSGDLLNDNSYGNWFANSDTLKIKFDTINYPNSRYKEDLEFIIKRKKLYYLLYNEEKYNELIDKISESGIDTLKIPSYRKFNRVMSKTMTNDKGNMKRQYFKLSEAYDCKCVEAL